jgi:hypothetical protein
MECIQKELNAATIKVKELEDLNKAMRAEIQKAVDFLKSQDKEVRKNSFINTGWLKHNLEEKKPFSLKLKELNL